MTPEELLRYVSLFELLRMAVSGYGSVSAWRGRRVVRDDRSALEGLPIGTVAQRAEALRRELRMDLTGSIFTAILWCEAVLFGVAAVAATTPNQPGDTLLSFCSNAGQIIVAWVLAIQADRLREKRNSIVATTIIEGQEPEGGSRDQAEDTSVVRPGVPRSRRTRSPD